MLWEWTDPLLEYLAKNLWRCTEKIDGCNIRIEIADAEPPHTVHSVKFDGRSDSASLPAELVNWLAGKFLDPRMLEILSEKFPGGATLYGEGFGEGIAKNGGYYGSFQSFILFDVRVGDWWLERKNVVNVADALGLKCVREVGIYTLPEAIKIVEDGFPSEFGDFLAEGMVAEPMIPMYNRAGERVITKIKTRDFLRVAEELSTDE